jgi:hypothetical protein
MLLKIVTATLAAVILVVLPGCGDPFSDGTTSTDEITSTDGTTSSLTITAVDGYITGATVIDQQGNTAVSNGDGTYSFVNTPIYPISLTGGTLVDTGDAFSANIITGSGEAHMYATSGGVISPITTLLTTITNNKATATIDSTLSAKLASMMGVTEAELLTDFVASENVNLAKITQVIHLMAQEPGLYSTFKTNLSAASGSLFSGVSGAATTTMNAKNLSGDLSAIKRTVYAQIISDVGAYTGTAAGLEAGIDGNKSMLENIATIETLSGNIGSDIASLQTASALAEIAGSRKSTKTITAAQLTKLGVSSTITDSATSVALMADVIRQSTIIKYDTKAEVQSLETHITHFVSIDTQAAVVSDANLLAAYKVILDDTTIETYKQVSLAAHTNATSAVTATSVAAIQTLLDGTADIAAPVLTVTAVTLIENAGISQTIANASANFASGSKLGVFSLTSTGDYAALGIDSVTGEVTVNDDPDFETKTSYVFTVKVTAVTDDSSALAIGDSSVQTTGVITNVGEHGIASVEYSYGAEDDNAHAIGGTNGESDNTIDNALLITFNVPVSESTLVPENFSIGAHALDSGLLTSYDAGTLVLTITIGDATIDVDAADGATSTIYASSSVKADSGLDLDTLITGKVVVPRTGIPDSDSASNLTYNTVKSPYGVYWLDRNLGATRVATSATDTAAFGGLYQWGRPADGHQIHSDSTPASPELPEGGVDLSGTLSTTITPGNAIFIAPQGSPYDWVDMSAQDGGSVDNGLAREAFLNKIDGTGICPTGFRVPSEDETELGIEAMYNPSYVAAYDTFLKLTYAGARKSYDGEFLSSTAMAMETGSLWTTTSDRELAVTFTYSEFGVEYVSPDSRAWGMSVRCRSHN